MGGPCVECHNSHAEARNTTGRPATCGAQPVTFPVTGVASPSLWQVAGSSVAVFIVGALEIDSRANAGTRVGVVPPANRVRREAA